jgi:signal transduction histidine kinase
MLRTLLLLSVAAFFALLAYSALDSVDYTEQWAYFRDLRRMQATAAELNERVLMSRSALMLQYDPLVNSLHELGVLQQRLRQVPAFVGSAAARDLRARLDASEAQLRQKDDLVESFKTHNSVLQNSLRYFPTLANAVIDRALAQPAGGALASRIQGLISAIMLFDTSADADSSARVRSAQAELGASAPAAQALHLAPELALILAHSTIILERKPITDRIVQGILAVPSNRTALQLEEAYAAYYRAAIERALMRRMLLFALALLTVVLGLTDVILRIRRSANALQAATADLRVANAALAREREKERQLGELKTRFVSMTSHEFRTPLSVIVSSSELLERYSERWDAERRLDHLERIRSAAASMSRMLEEILFIGRAEAGVLRAQPAALNLDEFCRRLVESLEQGSGASPRIRYTFQGSPWVVLDDRLLSEVVGNLLSNALKYSAREAEVLFDATADQEECQFAVQDRGIGIPEADIERLFESFFRASNANPVQGSGLGLAVVRKALDVQGGSITVRSELGRGTRFVVLLPHASPATS